jgi:hypothetical protein
MTVLDLDLIRDLRSLVRIALWGAALRFRSVFVSDSLGRPWKGRPGEEPAFCAHPMAGPAALNPVGRLAREKFGARAASLHADASSAIFSLRILGRLHIRPFIILSFLGRT